MSRLIECLSPFPFLNPRSNRIRPGKRSSFNRQLYSAQKVSRMNSGPNANPFDDDGFDDITFSVSVCSPQKQLKRHEAEVSQLNMSISSRSRWDDTNDLMDFDELPLHRAMPPSDDEEHAAVLTLNYFAQNTVVEFPAIATHKARKMPVKIENPRDYNQTMQFKKCSSQKGFRVVTQDGREEENVSIYEVAVPAESFIIQYLKFVPPPNCKGGESFRDVWYCYVDTSYWVKLTLIAKTAEVAKKTVNRGTGVWKKAPKIPVKTVSRGFAKPLGTSSVVNAKSSVCIGSGNQRGSNKHGNKFAEIKDRLNQKAPILEGKENTAEDLPQNGLSTNKKNASSIYGSSEPRKYSNEPIKSENFEVPTAFDCTKKSPSIEQHNTRSGNDVPDMTNRRRSRSWRDGSYRTKSPCSNVSSRSSSCVSAKKQKLITPLRKLAQKSGFRKKKSPKVAQKVLDLSKFKKQQGSFPASGSLFYDDSAVEKQLFALGNYLNDLFQCHPNPNQMGAISSVKDERELLQLRQKVSQIFKIDEVSRAITELEKEIHAGKLAIRTDIKLTFDIALRNALIDLVLNFNPLWLCIVLDVVFADCVPNNCKSSLTCDMNDLTRFLTKHFIARHDLDIVKPSQFSLALQSEENCGSGVVDELHRHILRKFFLLVLVLDRAKMLRIIPQDPCLFKASSTIKTTNTLVCQFCRLCLKSEGSIIKHLGNLGYVLYYKQVPLDEFDLTIKNVGTDLCDGVRLAKALDFLMCADGEGNLSRQLRFPCENRSRKIHNVSLALDCVCRSLGIEQVVDSSGQDVTAADIVDGNCAKTAALLWLICLDLKLCDKLVNKDDVKLEIDFIKGASVCEVNPRNSDPEIESLLIYWAFLCMAAETDQLTNSAMHQLSSFLLSAGGGNNVREGAFDGVIGSAMLCCILHFYIPDLFSRDLICFPTTTSTTGLQAAVADNLTLFSLMCSKLGSVPHLIYVSNAHHSSQSARPTNSLFSSAQTSGSTLNHSVFFSHYATEEGICSPSLKIDRKVFLLTLAVLFTRVTTLRKEVKAARVIQKCWRNYSQRKGQKIASLVLPDELTNDGPVEVEVDNDFDGAKNDPLNPNVVQSNANEESIQSEDDKEIFNSAALKVQIWFKSSRLAAAERNKFRDLLLKVIRIQSWWRGIIARRNYRLISQLVVSIQAASRGYLLRQSLFNNITTARVLFKLFTANNRLPDRSHHFACGPFHSHGHSYSFASNFVENYAATVVQKYLRTSVTSLKVRREFANKKAACVTIQRSFRRYREAAAAAVALEQAFIEKERLRREESQRIKLTAAVVFVQQFWRNKQETLRLRCDFRRKRRAALVIQCAWRAFVCRKRYSNLLSSANCISRWYRSVRAVNQAKDQLLTAKLAVIKLQTAVRGYLVRSRLAREKRAAVVIQCHFRSFREQTRYLRVKAACEFIQNSYRLKLEARSRMQAAVLYEKRVVLLQSAVRGYLTRKAYHKRLLAISAVKQAFVHIKSAVVIQRQFRKERPRLLLRYYRKRLHRAVTKIQSGWRGYSLRRDLKFVIESAIVIQRAFRRHSRCKPHRAHLRKCIVAAITIQSAFRGYKLRRRFTVEKARSAVAVLSEFYLKRRGTSDRHRRQVQAATRIQSYWRGSRVRMNNRVNGVAEIVGNSDTPEVVMKKNRRLSQICSNLQQLDPDTLTLQARMNAGISSLLNLMMVSKILPVLSEIEICTRWSQACCEQLARVDRPLISANGVGKEKSEQQQQPIGVLIELMDRCCRSVADQDILMHAVDIFINVIKVKTCQKNLHRDPALFPLLLIILTRSNPAICKSNVASRLYRHTCFLLQILLQFPQCKKMLKQFSREVDKLRNQHRVEVTKEKNRLKNKGQSSLSRDGTFNAFSNTQNSASGSSHATASSSSASKSGKKKSVAKMNFDMAHLHPEWELCQVRLEPAESIVLALERLLVQIQVPIERLC